MKKKQLALLIPAVALALLMTGCNLGMADTVRIVTDPTVSVNLGSRTNVFSEFIDIDQELADMTADTEGLTRDTTIANGDPITLNLQQDMIDISINDFAGETLELDTVDQAIDPVTFNVPAISSNETIAQGFDPIDLPVDANIPTVSISSAEPGTSISQTLTTPAISAAGFDTMTFATGTLTGNVAVSGGSGTVGVTINSATIMDGATAVVSSNNVPVTATGDLSFDLAGVTLPSSFTIELDVTINGGVPTTPFDLDLTFSFSADTTVSAATGITVHESVSDTISITMASANVISATIGTGGVDLDLTFGAGWSGLTTTIDMDLIQNGSSVGSVTGVPIDATPEWDFAGMTLGSGDLTLNYTVHVDSVTDNSADFAVETGVNEITGSAVSTITNFSSLTMSATGMNFQQEQATNLGSDITDLVQTINFNSSAGVTVNLTNNLPTDLDVTITSAALGVSGTVTYTGNSSTEVSNNWDILDTVNIASITDSAIDADTDPDVDFTVDISLTGFDETNEELTMTNVTPGATYSLAGSVVADLTIDSVVIASATMSDQFPAAGDDPLDFSMLGDFLPDTITFDNISANFDLFLNAGNMSLDMEVYAEYDTATASGLRVALVGIDANDDDIPDDANNDGYPDAPLHVTNASLLIDPLVPINGISTLLNDRASNVVIYYDVSASGATVTFDGSQDQRISAAVSADIPFVLTASENAVLLDENDEPLIPAADEDLFGRDGSADDEDINDFLDMLSSATMELTFTTPDTLNPVGDSSDDLLGIGFSMTESTNPAGYDNFSIARELTITKGTSTTLSISLTPDDVARMIADDAFMPVYDIYLIGQYEDTSDADSSNWISTGYSGDHKFVEGFDLNISAIMNVQSDVDYTIDL